MNEIEFHQGLAELRPCLHRYCARMVGSAVDGEDVLQETLLKAVRGWSKDVPQENIEGWLFRIAHNTSLDFLRSRKRRDVVPLSEDVASASPPEPQITRVAFRTFLRLPELQRCAVVLKDVLGYSAEEIAAIIGCTTGAAKSALQRGRVNLRRLAAEPQDVRLPIMTDQERILLSRYVALFQNGDFDGIREMLTDGVKLELVNRMRIEGSQKVGMYFTRYKEEAQWNFVLGAIEGLPAILAFDIHGVMEKPTHFVLIDWDEGRISAIRDFIFAPYTVEVVEWARLRESVIPNPEAT